MYPNKDTVTQQRKKQEYTRSILLNILNPYKLHVLLVKQNKKKTITNLLNYIQKDNLFYSSPKVDVLVKLEKRVGLNMGNPNNLKNVEKKPR